MIASILPGSTNFHAVGYNDHKVSKGTAKLLEIRNFGNLGLFHPPTTEEKIAYLQKYTSRNERIRKAQFHVTISCKGKEMTEEELLDFAHRYMTEMGYMEPGQPMLIYSHTDTANNHLHIITSRIAPNGRKIQHSNERRRSQEVIDRLLKIDRKKEVEQDLAKAKEYTFNSFAQFKAVMGTVGYETFAKNDTVFIKKGGKIQISFPSVDMDALYNKDKVDKERARQLRQILLKVRDTCANKEELQKEMKQNFGVDLIFFGSKDKPYGYMTVDHATKSVFHGARILNIEQLLDFATPEERLCRIESFIEDMFRLNPDMTRKELSDKLRKHRAYIKEGKIHFSEQSRDISESISKRLHDNQRMEWIRKFNPASDEERSILCRIAKIEDSDRIILSEETDEVKRDLLNIYKQLFDSEGQAKLREQLTHDGFVIKSDGLNRFAIDFHRHIILNLTAAGIDLRKPKREYPAIRSSAQPRYPHSGKPMFGKPIRDNGTGSRSINREWEVGNNHNDDDPDYGSSLKR